MFLFIYKYEEYFSQLHYTCWLCGFKFSLIKQHEFIFIIKGFRTIFFAFIVISTTFRLICPLAFFRCFVELGNLHGLRTTWVTCSDSVSHNRVQVLSIHVLLLACSEDWTCKLTTVCLPYVKGLAERILKICCQYDIRTVFTSGSTVRRYLFRVKPPTEFNMIGNCVYSIPCSCGKINKGETGRPLKVRLEEHRKALVRGEIEKPGLADHKWKEKGNYLPLWDKVEIIDRAEHWRIRRLKESALMLDYKDLLSRPTIELNTIWEQIIKKARW